MSSVNKIGIFLVLMTLLASCDPIEVEKFPAASYERIDGYQSIQEAYLVKNWWNTSENEKILDEFVCNHLRDDFYEIHTYFISFYNYTSEVNNAKYLESKKLCQLDMYDEHIITYEFRYGIFTKGKQVGKKMHIREDKVACDKIKEKAKVYIY